MFNIVRFIIGCAFLGTSFVAIRKSKIIRKHILYFVFTGVSVALIATLAFLPFENIFVDFDSPNAVYDYCKVGKSNIALILEGKECDLVIDHQNNVDTYLIVPKTEDGWKIGLGANTKRITQILSEGISISVYQYKNTCDYFITILDANGGESIISDEHNTEFYGLEKENAALGITFVTYYAHIPSFDSQYSVIVNGSKIALR